MWKENKIYTLQSEKQKKYGYMLILREMEDGYIVKISRTKNGFEKVHTDYISKILFDSCLRTGFIKEIK